LRIEVNKTTIPTHFCEAVSSLPIACAISTPPVETHLADRLIFSHVREAPQNPSPTFRNLPSPKLFKRVENPTLHLAAGHGHATIFTARSRHISHLEESFKDMIKTLFV
jgi:hypothetical protein